MLHEYFPVGFQIPSFTALIPVISFSFFVVFFWDSFIEQDDVYLIEHDN